MTGGAHVPGCNCDSCLSDLLRRPAPDGEDLGTEYREHGIGGSPGGREPGVDGVRTDLAAGKATTDASRESGRPLSPPWPEDPWLTDPNIDRFDWEAVLRKRAQQLRDDDPLFGGRVTWLDLMGAAAGIERLRQRLREAREEATAAQHRFVEADNEGAKAELALREEKRRVLVLREALEPFVTGDDPCCDDYATVFRGAIVRGGEALAETEPEECQQPTREEIDRRRCAVPLGCEDYRPREPSEIRSERDFKVALTLYATMWAASQDGDYDAQADTLRKASRVAKRRVLSAYAALRRQVASDAVRFEVCAGRMRACNADGGAHELIEEVVAWGSEARATLFGQTDG